MFYLKKRIFFGDVYHQERKKNVLLFFCLLLAQNGKLHPKSLVDIIKVIAPTIPTSKDK